MAKSRGLLTPNERDAMAGHRAEYYREKTRDRVEERIGQLAEDVSVLAEHDPELLAKLEQVVCQDAAVPGVEHGE